MTEVTKTAAGSDIHKRRKADAAGPEPGSDIHERRKADHIRINLEEDVAFKGLTTGLEAYFFMHRALPELDLAAVDTGVTALGKRLRTPLLISSMTGGTARAQAINRELAAGAQAAGMAMAVITGFKAGIQTNQLHGVALFKVETSLLRPCQILQSCQYFAL